MHIAMAYLEKGDVTLIPNPGYPTYSAACSLAGATVESYELSASTGWLPDLKALEKRDLSKVKIMWVNYPHMPTGAQATVEGRITFTAPYEGAPGCVHGGFIASAFDEVLGVAQSASGQPGMTANLTVDYRSPTPLLHELVFRGWCEKAGAPRIGFGECVGTVLPARAPLSPPT